MAIYYFHSTLRKREGKQPFLSTVAHHAGEAITDQKTQKVYGVGQSSQHIQSTVLLPSECGEMERSTLWNAVAAIDVDRQTAVALVLSIILPFELSETVNWSLAERYLQRSFLSHQLAVDLVVRSIQVGSGHQSILQAMVPVFQLEASGVTDTQFDFTKIGYIARCRRRWVRYANCELKRAGYPKMQPPHPLLSPKLELIG